MARFCLISTNACSVVLALDLFSLNLAENMSENIPETTKERSMCYKLENVCRQYFQLVQCERLNSATTTPNLVAGIIDSCH